MSAQDDIRTASTPKGKRYTSRERLDAQRETLFLEAFHLLPELSEADNHSPFNLMPGFLDEPLLLTRDREGALRCLSNVCTHRGMLLCAQPGSSKTIRCPYHGRRFGLDGSLEEAPGFDQAREFPRAEDHLSRLEIHHWGPLRFIQLQRDGCFEEWLKPVQERLSFLPLSEFQLDRHGLQEFEVQAHWELYVENYLEGFHVPYVHKSLAAAIDTRDYRLENFKWGSVQIALGKESGLFELPKGHPEEGLNVAAWYFHLFPNLMVNVYPWGLSINVVEPLTCSRTRVRFIPYVWRPELRQVGAGVDLGRVELEDEAVVEAVQLGVQSRLYPGGRYAPGHEDGVYHFHRLLER